MQRQREIAVDSEEELLRMQEQFAASKVQGDARPAAKVTRISRRPAAAASPAAGTTAAASAQPGGCSVHGPACQGHHGGSAGAPSQQQQAADLMATLQAAMKDIVGEVTERPAGPSPAPPLPPAVPPPAASAAGSSFPEATHRKLSKFALGRQRQRSAPPGGADGAGPSLAPPQLPASMDEGSRIDAENRHLLSAMSAEQLEEAREEALQRLPPAAVEFLRKRGPARAAAGAASGAAAAGGSAGPTAAGSAAQQRGDDGAGSAAGGGERAMQRPRQQQKQQGAASVQRGASQATLAARLRFNMGGSVAGLRPAGPADADVAPADVAERDPLRQEGGAGGQGYSVQEACLLARSTLPQQRQLALRLLAAVLALSRPRPGAVPGGGLVPLPSQAAAELQQEQQGAAATLEWAAVWHHALHSADIVLLLRRSLDDSHPAVAAAAAEALAALLGASGPAGVAEEAAAEAADACPLTGWPAPPLRHLQRPTAGGAWVAAPTLPEPLGGEVEEGDEEPLDEGQLAKVDPLSGLLHMQLLERAVYLIGKARAAAALDPLLSILIRCCQAGKDVADHVADAPGMLDALKTVLDAPPPPAPAAAGGAATDGPPDAAAVAYYAARPKALRLLRHLAAASKAAARRLQESGLVRFAFEQLLRSSVAPTGSSGIAGGTVAGTSTVGAAAAASPRQTGMLTEALRLWRSFAQHGFFMLSLDDAYPSLCSFFTPPALAAAADGAVGAPTASAAAAGMGETAPAEPAAGAAGAVAAGDLQQWCVAREAYSTVAQLCWHAARSEPHNSQLSPQCAAALASGALTWLAGVPLQQLVDACLPAGSSSMSQQIATAAGAGDASALARLSAYPALALASGGGGGMGQQAVLLGTLAAALHCVGSYWSVQVWHTAAEKAAAAAQLGQLGLLPGSGGGGDSGSSKGPMLQAVGNLLGRLVGSDAVWRQPSGASSSTGLAATAAAVAAAAVGAAELAVSLARLAATFLSHRQAAGTASALLAPLCGQLAAARFLQAAQAADPTLLQPWDAARQQQLLPLARAATAGLQTAAVMGRAEGRVLPAPAVDVALALLRLLPPGQEAAALQLLALLLGPGQLAGTAAAATAALKAAAAGGGGKVALLAAQRDQAADDGNGGQDGGGPPALPDMKQLSPVLLAGYAASWLGLVPDPQEQGSGEQQEALAAAAMALEPPPNAALLRPQGSRLPLPADWAVQEVPLPPGEAGITCDAGTAAAGALLLLLGCEEQHPASLAGAAAEQKLRSAVLLLFGEQQAPSGVVPGASLAAVAEEEEEQPVWRHPMASWCLAALMERYAGAPEAATVPTASAEAEAEAAAGGGAPGLDASAASAAAVSGGPSWQQQESRQLAERFAAVSYGDRLFGAAVALLLRQAVPLETQLEVLATLEEGQALHLLPPLRLLPGPALAYLDPPGSGGTGAFGRACFGLAPGGSTASSTASSRRQELDPYFKLLSEGPLERCLAAGSGGDDGPEAEGGSEGNGSCCASCSVAVPLVLHRLACACFSDTAAQPIDGQQQQQGLLVELLHRCTGGSPGLLRLLGWLLRWDATAGQPSDVITRGRLAAIEAACAAGGMDASGLLRAALEA